jgi:pyridoxal phosphate enzyme (YggS family)
MGIIENLEHLKKQLYPQVKLVAVSKTKPVEDIIALYNAGNKLFGENKVQEILLKQPHLPDDIEWHFIGHLQTNKVRYIAPFISMIHSIDSLKLLSEINKQAQINQRIIDCLLQFHIATEETKFGLNYLEAQNILESPEYAAMHNIRICGVMGMATFTEDENKIRNEFQSLKIDFEGLKKEFFESGSSFKEISMGMTEDYKIAIEEGSTMVRIGTALFGERIYS